MTSATRFSAKALTAVAARIAAAKRIVRNEIIAQLSPCHMIRSVRRSEQGSFGIEDNASDLPHSSVCTGFFAALGPSDRMSAWVKSRPQTTNVRCPLFVGGLNRSTQ